MSEIDRLLDDYRDEGVEDSEGTFTMDFAKAREKLARFQLPDPHELILKLVQAGNLASRGVAVAESANGLQVDYQEWDQTLTLQRLADRLASASLLAGDDALSHLSVGLSALMGLGQVVRLRQEIPGQKTARVLLVGQTMEWEEEEAEGRLSSLQVSTGLGPSLRSSRIGELLKERCLFSSVPILWQGMPVKSVLPEPAGAHRPQYFRENKVLAQHYLTAEDSAQTPLLHSYGTARKSARMAFLSLTVDLDPKATIWFCKAGVLAEKKRLDLGTPGLIGMVCADDVPTDLTGSQFLQGEPLAEVESWLRESGRALLGDAIGATQHIISQSQPANNNAPVATKLACSGCGFALLGWMIGVAIIANTRGTSDWIMPNLLFWLMFPCVWVGYHVWRYGCEKDDKSDLAARAQLLETLKKFRRS